MGDSLQDQLRALGLSRKAPEPENRKQKKPRPAGRRVKADPPPGPDRELSLDRAYELRQREEQRQAERSRQQKLEDERRRRLLNLAIREIVESRRQNSPEAEIARNFLYKGRIRKVHVTADQQKALSANELGIVYLAGSYHLLEPDALEAVRQISEEHVVDLGLQGDDDETEHPVPDDLTW